jgi:aryl-alcohol dehydrogenase-like predicted oxidoreductase
MYPIWWPCAWNTADRQNEPHLHASAAAPGDTNRRAWQRIYTSMPATNLERRKIGALEVSLTGLGCNNFGWRIDAAQSRHVVETALDSGINFFDTADIYDTGRSEEYLGRALADRRREAVIATKFGMKFDETHDGASGAYVHQAAEDSLRRLGTDYIDLYQLHRPDPNTPIAETLGALNELVREGKVREIGCSNFSAEQMREAERSLGSTAGARAHFVSVQNEYNLMHREPEGEVLPECRRLGVAFLPYFPLANGLLTGKYRRGQPLPKGSRGEAGFGPKVFTEENVNKVERLIQFGAVHGHSLLELAFSWLAAQPAVASVIAGAVSPEQVRANAAAPLWKLNPEDLREIDTLLA